MDIDELAIHGATSVAGESVAPDTKYMTPPAERPSRIARWTKCADCQRYIIERDGLPQPPGAGRAEYRGLVMHEVCAMRHRLQDAERELAVLTERARREDDDARAYVVSRRGLH